MKRILGFFLVISLLLTCLMAFSSCDESPSVDTLLTYSPLSDGTYGVKVGRASYLSEIVIPSTYNDKPVTKILDNAFYSCKGLKSIVIPDSVTSIGDRAFYGCKGLTSIVIPDSVTSIGNHAFRGCTNLTSMTIGDGVESIGNSAFRHCKGLDSIVIPDSVTSIGNRAFYGCTGLTSVYISDIGAWCRISFSSSASNPLYYAKKLYLNGELVTELVIPDSVTSIGNWAFYGCTGLTSIVIPDSVTSIGNWAFYGCKGLTSIVIPDSVTSIGNHAFRGCTGLAIYCEASSKPSEWKKLWSLSCPVVWGIDGITEDGLVWLSTDTAVTIAGYVGSVTEIVIPATIDNMAVTSIGNNAFEDCTGLTSIVIPDSVTSIGAYAFYNCTNLTSVTFKNTTGWKAGRTSLSSIILANTSTAATYLRSTYYKRDWTRE